MSELTIKEKSQLSVNINSFDGIVNIQKLQTTIKENLARNDELYFIDEIEKFICETGNKLVKYQLKNLVNKYELLNKKKEDYEDFIDGFNQEYNKRLEEVKQIRKDNIKALSAEQEGKRVKYIEQHNNEEITKEELTKLVINDMNFYNTKRAEIMNFKDIDGFDLEENASSYYTEYLVYKKLTSDTFKEAEWKEKEIKENELDFIKKELTLLNQQISSLAYINFNQNMKEFSSIFTKESFSNIDISENIKNIKANLNKIKSVLLPVALIHGVSDNMTLKVISRLIINTTFYGKKDDETIRKNANALKADLEEFSFYAIQKGIKEYCKNNKDYPALKGLIDIIEPKHNKGLMIFTNTQFLLSL